MVGWWVVGGFAINPYRKTLYRNSLADSPQPTNPPQRTLQPWREHGRCKSNKRKACNTV
nr:MAG TPA: hypothetical protein [Caudoviricetes sp.]